MRTYLLFLSMLSTLCIQAMENHSEWVIKYNNTKIHLTTKSLYDVCDKVNIAIVGHHEQNLLYEIHPDSTHTGLETFYDRYYIYKTKDICKRKKEGSTITIIEPYLQKNSCLNKHRQLAREWEYVSRENQIFHGNQALEEALKDLALCYNKTLSYIINTIKEYPSYIPHPNPKSIAIPTLSTKVGFPFDEAAPIAITTILKFLNIHPDSYNDIYLSVDDSMQFKKYQWLVLKHTGLLHKMRLFYLGNMLDEKSFLAELPQDIVKLILRLI